MKSLTVQPSPPVKAPIRTLGAGYRVVIERHLLALGERDRYLRFGCPASDEHIHRYVAGLDFNRDEVFGIFNRKLELIAMAHLAYMATPDRSHKAEFGVSVSASARGRGLGSQLFERAVMRTRNQGVTEMIIHALSENAAMLKIARKAGARIVRDGSESEAYLALPPADFESQLSDLWQEQVALTDFHFKSQAKQVRGILDLLRNIARGSSAERETV